MFNENRGCIEIYLDDLISLVMMFNENRGCIEIRLPCLQMYTLVLFNENRGCIEIASMEQLLWFVNGLMKTEVVLKC